MRLFLSIACAVCLSGPAIADAPERQIVVSGVGEVAVAPDMATVTLGVEAHRKTARDAVSDMSEDATAILDTLAAAGIEKADMQTSGLNLYPVWSSQIKSNQTRQIDGFIAATTLTVRVRELDGLGAVLDRVISDGANRFQGVSFGVQDPDPLMDQARLEAVAEARRKALLLADAAGVELGALLSLSESGGGHPRPVQMHEAARSMAADVPIAAGEVAITAQVSMVYRIN